MWAQVLVTALAFKQSRAQQNLSDRNKTGLSRPNTWATATSKKIHDVGSLLSFLRLARISRRLYSQGIFSYVTANWGH